MPKHIFTPILFLSGFIACLIITSCKKDDAGNSNSIIGKWKITAYIHDGGDVYGTAIGPCIIDDITTFSNPNILSLDEGPTKCNPSNPQTITGTYSLNSTQTLLTTTDDMGVSDIDSVLVLSSTTLKLKQLSNEDLVTYTRIP